MGKEQKGCLKFEGLKDVFRLIREEDIHTYAELVDYCTKRDEEQLYGGAFHFVTREDNVLPIWAYLASNPPVGIVQIADYRDPSVFPWPDSLSKANSSENNVSSPVPNSSSITPPDIPNTSDTPNVDGSNPSTVSATSGDSEDEEECQQVASTPESEKPSESEESKEPKADEEDEEPVEDEEDEEDESEEDEEITSFRGSYAFLSNSYDSPFTFDGRTFLNAEAAYQSTKTSNPSIKGLFTSLSADTAKRVGRQLPLDKDEWEKTRVKNMWRVLCAKFSLGTKNAQDLVNTGNAPLVFANTSHQNFWGECRCGKCNTGLNMLGKLLMDVREGLKNPLLFPSRK